MGHNVFTANGEQCLNRLSQLRGQPHRATVWLASLGFPCNPNVQAHHKKLVSTQYLLTAIHSPKAYQGRLSEDEVKCMTTG